MNKLLIIFVFMLWSNLSYSQIQLKRWYFSPKNIDMTQQVPSIGNIGGASVNVSQVANGAYDKNDPAGAPMFFIADNTVFDRTGNPMSGFVTLSLPRTAEVAVMPAIDNSPRCEGFILLFDINSNFLLD